MHTKDVTMNLKKRVATLATLLVLSMGMTAGIAAAQTSDSEEFTITVLCGVANSNPSTVSIEQSPNATSVNFEDLDPSDPEQRALRSTEQKALRLVMIIDSCLDGDWHVDATITDFTSGTAVISGTKFQLPNGEPLASTMALTTDDDTPVPNVTGPSAPVLFEISGGTDAEGRTIWNGSTAIAIATGPATGSMYMDFTGTLVDLDAATADGTYTATFTVTWQAGMP